VHIEAGDAGQLDEPGEQGDDVRRPETWVDKLMTSRSRHTMRPDT